MEDSSRPSQNSRSNQRSESGRRSSPGQRSGQHRNQSPNQRSGSNNSQKPRPKFILAVYPVTPKSIIPISKSIQNKCQVKLESPIVGYNLNEKIGKLIIKDPQTKIKVLENYDKLDEKIIISSVDDNFIQRNFSSIKKLNGILTDDNTTLDISNLDKRLNYHVNLDNNMQTVLFILAIATFKHIDDIKTIIFDNNRIKNQNAFFRVPDIFKKVETISIKGNITNTAKLSKSGIKVISDKSDSDIEDEDISPKGKDSTESIESDTEKSIKSDSTTISYYGNPPSLPDLDTRFQITDNFIDHDQDRYFNEMMTKFFEPQSSVGDKFYDPTAVFSFTVSDSIANQTGIPIYNFLKENECNLINISNANHKWLGTNFFFDCPDVFPNGMKRASEKEIKVMPTVAIGCQLFAVVVHATLMISYIFEKRQIDMELNSIHTFTIRYDGESSYILSHQVFLHE